MMTMQRNTFIAALLSLLLAACTGGGGNVVDITIEGAGGRTATLERFEGDRTIVVDSTKLDGQGHGTLKTTSLPLDFYRISLSPTEWLPLITDSSEKPVIVVGLDALDAPRSVEGSAHTRALYAFQGQVKAYDQEREELRGRITADAEASRSAIDELNAMNISFYEETKRFVQENSASPAAITALGKLSIQRDMDLFKKVRDDLRSAMPRSIFFAQFRENVDRMEQQEVAIKLQQEEEKRLANLLPIGGEAPDFSQQTPEGGTLSLSELRGKYVLIDFWASWCKPCRFENPAVKRVYDKYKNKGFEILGVSLDRNHDAWVGAIQADGINWKHVSDLGFWNNAVAQQYGVSSIPFTVLVDKEGKIVAKGLRAQQLEMELARIFGS